MTRVHSFFSKCDSEKSKRREKEGAAPNLLMGALRLEREHTQSASYLPKRPKVLFQETFKFDLSWQKDIIFPTNGKQIQHVWVQEVRKQILITGEVENIADKPGNPSAAIFYNFFPSQLP